MKLDELKADKVLRGPIFPEPVQVLVTTPVGYAIRVIAKGLNTGRVHDLILTPEKLAGVETSPEKQQFDGDAQRFRLAVEASHLLLMPCRSGTPSACITVPTNTPWRFPTAVANHGG